MTEDTVFWDRVQAGLDARRDPLEDEEVCRHLLDQPELLDAYSRLVQSVRLVEEGRSRARREWPPYIRVTVLLAVAAALMTLIALFRLPGTRTVPNVGVEYCRIEVVHESTGRKTSTVFDSREKAVLYQETRSCDRGQEAYTVHVVERRPIR